MDNDEWIYGQLLYFKSNINGEELAIIVEGAEWTNNDEWFNLGSRAKVNSETIRTVYRTKR